MIKSAKWDRLKSQWAVLSFYQGFESARPTRPSRISIGVRRDPDAPHRARVQPHPPVRRDARTERHPDQGRAAHRTARPSPQAHRLDLHEVAADELLGLAATTLALGSVYRLMRERDERPAPASTGNPK